MARAREHRIELQACLDAYLHDGSFALKSDYQINTGWNELRFEAHREPPNDRVALILGDVMANARASLDYLVWQLVLHAGTDEPGRHTAFPVVREASRWRATASTCLKGAGAQWTHAIEDLQPYNDSAPDQHPLVLLDAMNNINKHRALPPSIYKAHKLTMPKLPVTPGAAYEFENPDPPLVDGAVIFRVRSSDHAQIVIPPVGLVLRMGFDDGTGVQWDNEDLLDWVENAIDSFEPVFRT